MPTSLPSEPKLLIHRGEGFYLQEANGRSATWNRDPTQAREFSLHEAERWVLYLNDALLLQCEAVDPVLAQITRTMRWIPTSDTQPPGSTDTSPRRTLTLS